MNFPCLQQSVGGSGTTMLLLLLRLFQAVWQATRDDWQPAEYSTVLVRATATELR